ncbi:MAG: radical SAM protein [Patescibacteria group bacterium]
MKILLIYPPETIYGPGIAAVTPPLGLAYLAAYILKFGYEVQILDTLAEGKGQDKIIGKYHRFGLSEKKIKKWIADYQPDVVGISVMFTAFAQDALDVARLAKEVSKKIIVVLGGAHVSIDPKKTVMEKNVDVVVNGEGEVTFLNLLRALEGKSALSKVTGIAFRQGKKGVMTPPTPIVPDLDSLPFPARHLLPMEKYQSEHDPYNMRQPLTPIVTSRGCPAKCVYCSIHSIWGFGWRGRSPKNVVDELELLQKEYGIREVSLQDDSASLNKKRMAGICDEIINRKIDIRWTTPNGIAHWTLDKPLLEKMKKAGCYRITFGIESGNEEQRRWIGKPYSLAQAKELTQYANKLGFWTLATNIIGFPYETKDQMQDTINFAINSDVDFALFFRLGPRPGTPVYDVFKKEGWLPKDERVLFSESVACDTKYVKGHELYDIQNKAYSRFFKKRFLSFLNPMRIMRKIRSFEDVKYVSGLAFAGTKMALNLMGTKTGITSGALKKEIV